MDSGQLIYGAVDSKDIPFELPEDARKEEDASMEAIIVLRPPDEVLQHGCILDDRNSALLRALTSSEKGIKSLDELNVIGYIHRMLQLCPTMEGTEIFKDLQAIYTAYVQGLGQFNTHFTLSHAVIYPFDMCGHSKDVAAVGFLSDTLLLSGSWDETLRIWDVTTGEMTPGSPVTRHRGAINWVAVHIPKALVASASDDATIRLWTFESNGAVHMEKVLEDESNSAVYAVAFSQDGSHLVSGSHDGTVRLWNAAAGERIGEPVCRQTDRISSVAFSSDGTHVASGSRDRTVQLWKCSTGEGALIPCGQALSRHTAVVFSVAFSPDAHVLASGSKDKTVRIWDVATRTLKFTMEGHTRDVNSAVFSPSGAHIVSGSDDWTVRIWDTGTGTAVRVLRGHTDWVYSVVFSPDGQRIASGSRDKTVRVWDFASLLCRL